MVSIVGLCREGIDRMPEGMRINVEHTLNGVTAPYDEQDLRGLLTTVWGGTYTPAQLTEATLLLRAAVVSLVSDADSLGLKDDAEIKKGHTFLDKIMGAAPSSDVVGEALNVITSLDAHVEAQFVELLNAARVQQQEQSKQQAETEPVEPPVEVARDVEEEEPAEEPDEPPRGRGHSRGRR